ncbi:uncharacterized protein TrAtP1_001291 [Trichoderma atroviride]|uniref:uncharacterized protein n=1 Tax=Hypocrea atroviridis TaxID=63577 RepID=UPI00333155E4|nr:hypothetical protein TrAtP1_001291 [Trichoderma atroviride]
MRRAAARETRRLCLYLDLGLVSTESRNTQSHPPAAAGRESKRRQPPVAAFGSVDRDAQTEFNRHRAGTLSLPKAAGSGSHGGLSPAAAQMRSSSCSALSASRIEKAASPKNPSASRIRAAVDVARTASRTPYDASVLLCCEFPLGWPVCHGYLGREVLAAVPRYLGRQLWLA